MSDLQYLRSQEKSTWGRAVGATWVLPRICHLCGDDVPENKNVGTIDPENPALICYECLNARTNARNDLEKI